LWSELQDHFAIVMGSEFQNYEITALTLLHNDERARMFEQQMKGMQQRRRDAMPPWENWRKVAADAVASLGGGEFARYQTIFERGEFDWVRTCMSSDEKLKKELQRLGVSKEHTEQVLECVKRLQVTFESQEATMRHFKDLSAKFGMLPADENEDVNLMLAWWGNWRGNSV
jgi:DNA invertase Pin-like site-specific DNA recombinase